MGRKSSYENGMYQQLMEIMGRLDTIEKEHKKETGELKTEIADLKKENLLLRQENQLLKDDNARLKASLTMTVLTLPFHPLPTKKESLPIPITEEKNGT